MRDAMAPFAPPELVCFAEATPGLDALRHHPAAVLIVGAIDDDGLGTAQILEQVRDERLLSAQAVVVAISSERNSRRIMSLAEHAPDLCVLKPLSVELLRNRLKGVLELKHRLRPILLALEQGRLTAARLMCRELVVNHATQHSIVWRTLIDWLIDHGKHDAVPPAIEEAMQAGTQPWMLLAMARVRLLQDRLDEAGQMLDHVLTLFPESPAACDLRAQVAMRQGAHEEALLWLEKANSLTEFNLQRARHTGREAALAGELGVAEKAYTEIVSRVSGTDRLRADDAIQLVSVLGSRGRLEQAARVAVRERQVMGDGPDARVLRALLAHRQAVRDGGQLGGARTLPTLMHELDGAGDGVAVQRVLDVVEACFEQGWRVQALGLARRLLESDRARNADFARLSQLLGR